MVSCSTLKQSKPLMKYKPQSLPPSYVRICADITVVFFMLLQITSHYALLTLFGSDDAFMSGTIAQPRVLLCSTDSDRRSKLLESISRCFPSQLTDNVSVVTGVHVSSEKFETCSLRHNQFKWQVLDGLKIVPKVMSLAFKHLLMTSSPACFILKVHVFEVMAKHIWMHLNFSYIFAASAVPWHPIVSCKPWNILQSPPMSWNEHWDQLSSVDWLNSCQNATE